MNATYANGYSMIQFAAKPALDIRNTLKSHGYRWSPSAGHWYRKCAAHEHPAMIRTIGTQDSPAVRADYSDLLYEDNCRQACGL